MQEVKQKQLNLEKLGIYSVSIASLIMLWQSWSGLHKDIADLRERICKLETKLEMQHSKPAKY